MKFILTLIFSITILSASERTEHLQAVILEKVLSQISINKSISIWSDNEKVLSQFKDHNRFHTTSSCKNANILIINNKENIANGCEDKHIFTLNYDLLSEIPSSFGAFFWKKGRPNIVIIEHRIKNQNIKISNSLKKYVEERIW